MGRPSKLSPLQWQEIERRAAGGEGVSALAREFGVSKSIVSARVSVQSERVREVAEKVAAADTALATLPIPQQYMAVSLAEKLRNISSNLAAAAELGSATAHRLNALANSEVAKVDDFAPLASLESLRSVGVLTKLANESAHVALNLLAANKERMQKADEPPPDAAQPMRPQTSREEWMKNHGLA